MNVNCTWGAGEVLSVFPNSLLRSLLVNSEQDEEAASAHICHPDVEEEARTVLAQKRKHVLSLPPLSPLAPSPPPP